MTWPLISRLNIVAVEMVMIFFLFFFWGRGKGKNIYLKYCFIGGKKFDLLPTQNGFNENINVFNARFSSQMSSGSPSLSFQENATSLLSKTFTFNSERVVLCQVAENY